MTQPTPTEATQRVLTSVRQLLAIADSALATAEPLLDLIGLPVDAERCVTVRNVIDTVLDGLPGSALNDMIADMKGEIEG